MFEHERVLCNPRSIFSTSLSPFQSSTSNYIINAFIGWVSTLLFDCTSKLPVHDPREVQIPIAMGKVLNLTPRPSECAPALTSKTSWLLSNTFSATWTTFSMMIESYKWRTRIAKELCCMQYSCWLPGEWPRCSTKVCIAWTVAEDRDSIHVKLRKNSFTSIALCIPLYT